MPEAFTWNVAEALPLIATDGTTSYVSGLAGMPLEEITGAAVYYYHTDQIGSARALTDSTGSVAASYDFDPYGVKTSSTGSVINPFQFAGQFTSQDPASSITRQPYSYVADSPTNRTDPTGLWGDVNDVIDTLSLEVAGIAVSAHYQWYQVTSPKGATYDLVRRAAHLTRGGRRLARGCIALSIAINAFDAGVTYYPEIYDNPQQGLRDAGIAFSLHVVFGPAGAAGGEVVGSRAVCERRICAPDGASSAEQGRRGAPAPLSGFDGSG